MKFFISSNSIKLSDWIHLRILVKDFYCIPIWNVFYFHSSVNYLRLWGLNHRPVLAIILLKLFRETKKISIWKRWLDCKDIWQVIQDGWNSPDLPTDANIMAHILCCWKALSQWRRQNNLNSEMQVVELK